MNDQEWEESFRNKLAEIKSLDSDEQEAVFRFMESLEDSKLTEEEWVSLYAYRRNYGIGERNTKKRL